MKVRLFTSITILCVVGVLTVQKSHAPVRTYVHAERSHLPKNSLSVGWVGDMVPSSDDAYNENAFAEVLPFTSEPDLMIGNLEGTFALPDRNSKCETLAENCHAFRGSESFALELRKAGFDFVSLVNNHSLDFGQEGLSDTEAVLDHYGIPYVSQNKPTASITIEGKSVGILGVSSTPPHIAITDYDYIAREISELKQKNDIVILIFHGGAEGADKTIVTGDNEFMGTENRGNVQEVARVAVEAGADLILGSGPHVLRKIEVQNNSLIAYSMGNFVGGMRLMTNGLLGVSGMLSLTLSDNELNSYSVIPIKLSKEGIPSFDATAQATSLLHMLGQ